MICVFQTLIVQTAPFTTINPFVQVAATAAIEQNNETAWLILN